MSNFGIISKKGRLPASFLHTSNMGRPLNSRAVMKNDDVQCRSYYNLTLEWLIRHNYPPGPIHLTRTHMPTLPVYYSVGNFKVRHSSFEHLYLMDWRQSESLLCASCSLHNSHSCCCVQVAYMESLKAKGLELFAAYGNTGTDARAYAAAGIPKVLHCISPVTQHYGMPVCRNSQHLIWMQ